MWNTTISLSTFRHHFFTRNYLDSQNSDGTQNTVDCKGMMDSRGESITNGTYVTLPERKAKGVFTGNFCLRWWMLTAIPVRTFLMTIYVVHSPKFHLSFNFQRIRCHFNVTTHGALTSFCNVPTKIIKVAASFALDFWRAWIQDRTMFLNLITQSTYMTFVHFHHWIA